jgi:hypothetical protein
LNNDGFKNWVKNKEINFQLTSKGKSNKKLTEEKSFKGQSIVTILKGK